MRCVWKCDQCDARGDTSETVEEHLTAHPDHTAKVSEWTPDPPPRLLLEGVDVASGRDIR